MRQPVQQGGLIPHLTWQVRPTEDSPFLVQSQRSRLEGGVRLVGNGGRVVYAFRVLGGMDVAIQLELVGSGQVRVRSEGGGLAGCRVVRSVRSYRIQLHIPLQPERQSLQVIIETLRRTQVRIFSLTVEARDRDEDRDGIGDSVERMLGAPANAMRPRQPTTPRSTYQTGADYDPTLDLVTDAVILHSFDPERLACWKARQYPVWIMGGFRDYASYAEAHPEHMQRFQDGSPFEIGGSFYLVPTPDRLDWLTANYLRMVEAGADGVCPEEPEYWADAGYEPAFQRMYAEYYQRAWQPPHESHAGRWDADRLKTELINRMVHTILERVRAFRPHVRRMVAVHSPLNYALWRICLAHYGLVFGKDDLVQDVIGQVWSDTIRTPILFRGENQPTPFATAFLEYASLAGLVRQSEKRLWFLMDPLSDQPTRPLSEHQSYYFASVVASVMFAEAQGYEVLPWPERIFRNVPPEYATTILSVTRALESISEQRSVSIDAGVEGIGALYSDSTTAMRGAPEIAPVEDLMALTVPLVHAGVPVSMLSFQRVVERTYLRGTNLLLWTPDSVKPIREAEIDPLANWVREGGWLVVVGGTNGYDAISEQPWRGVGHPTPVQWLLAKCGVRCEMRTVLAESAPSSAWRELARHGDQPQPGTLNRRWVEFDLSAHAGQTVYICFRDSLPQTGWGALVRQVRLEADGRTLTAFYTHTPAESLFLYHQQGSQRNSRGERFADGNAQFSYRFPLPKAQRITLKVEIAQEWLIEISTVPPYAERVLQPVRAEIPQLVARGDESLTLYTLAQGEPFYTYEGEPAGVICRVGRGGVALLGVSGRVFGNMQKGDEVWRAIMRYLCGQANLRYRERARIIAKRGDWVAVWGTYRTTTLRGTYLDVLDPRLTIQSDIPIEPNSARLFLQVEGKLQRAGMLHTNARILLQNETSKMLAYLVRGPEGVAGIARIGIRGLKGQVSLTDTLGNPLLVNTQRESETLLVRWNLSPAGQVLTVR